jgi:hypothetical protein
MFARSWFAPRSLNYSILRSRYKRFPDRPLGGEGAEMVRARASGRSPLSLTQGPQRLLPWRAHSCWRGEVLTPRTWLFASRVSQVYDTDCPLVRNKAALSTAVARSPLTYRGCGAPSRAHHAACTPRPYRHGPATQRAPSTAPMRACASPALFRGHVAAIRAVALTRCGGAARAGRWAPRARTSPCGSAPRLWRRHTWGRAGGRRGLDGGQGAAVGVGVLHELWARRGL